MARVDWRSLGAKQYEDMVAVLLSHIHPESIRIDGSGGDGGRDVQIASPDGAHVFELKSFTGRMTAGRRRQVLRSLRRATSVSPVSWTLIVPIDFNVGEDEWFARLAKTVHFPIYRKGLTWLDGQLAQRWYIARYFVDHLSDEIVRLAEILKTEQAVLTDGAPEAVRRAEALARQLNELDPFYSFEISTDGDRSSVRMTPRYKGAERDRPISGSFRFSFPQDSAGIAAMQAVRDAFEYGAAATVPREYVEEMRLDLPAGLGGTYKGGVIQFGAAANVAEPRPLILASVDPDGGTRAELPLTARVVGRGTRGAIMEGRDATGAMSLTAKFDTPDRHVEVALQLHTDAMVYPHEMKPLARLLASLRPPNRFSLRTEDGMQIASGATGAVPRLVPDWLPGIIDDLVLIQWEAGMLRKVPLTFTGQELNAVVRAAALLRGDRLETSWTDLEVRLEPDAPQWVRELFLGEEVVVVTESGEPLSIEVGGTAYPIGKSVRTEVHGRAEPRVTGLEAPEKDGVIRLVPASSDRAEVTLAGQ